MYIRVQEGCNFLVSFNLLPEDIVLVEVVAPVEVAPSLSAAWHLFLGLKIHKH